MIKQIGTGSVELNSTTSGGEDTSLGLSDWSIKDKFYWKSGSTWMLKSGSDEALRIIVRGYANTVVDATDATLSALSVSGATLSPAFDAATTSYHAVVANSVSQGTITETTSETTATVEYLDDSDATRTDADTMTAGLQVNLSVGSNIVKVKVTAPDTTTTKTYTVNVFRVAVPVACSAASMTNRIWTGNLTVGTDGRQLTQPDSDTTRSNLRQASTTRVSLSRATSYTIESRRNIWTRAQLSPSGSTPRDPAANNLITAHRRDQFLPFCRRHEHPSNQYGNHNWFSNQPHLGRRRRGLPGADGRGPGGLVGRADLRPRHRQHLRDRRHGHGDGDLRRGGRHHRHPGAGAGL